MLGQIVGFCETGVSACLYWASLFFDKTGMAGLIVAVFIAYKAVRLLLSPLLGQAGSDSVHGARDKDIEKKR